MVVLNEGKSLKQIDQGLLPISGVWHEQTQMDIETTELCQTMESSTKNFLTERAQLQRRIRISVMEGGTDLVGRMGSHRFWEFCLDFKDWTREKRDSED